MSTRPATARRDRRAVIAAVLAAATVPALATPALATGSFTMSRIAGSDRFATAADAARAAFPSGAATVVLANGLDEHFADALAANYLAGTLSAPVLLTSTDAAPAVTLGEITSLGATRVVVVGGPAAVSDAQVGALQAQGLTVTRLGGADRYATDAAVVASTGAGSAGSVEGAPTALVATGANFPDALAAGPLAFARHLPIVLVPGSSSTLSQQARATLTAAGAKQVVIVGGPSAVSSGIASGLSAMGLTVVRESGSDRTATATALAAWETAHAGFSPAGFVLASGAQSAGGADALAGGPLAGVRSQPMLITNGAAPGTVTGYATAHAATLGSAAVLGGDSAVPAGVVDAVAAAASGHPAPPVLRLKPGQDPPANVAPSPAFAPTCAAYGTRSSQCDAAALAAINHARSLEGVGPMTLPSNWSSLTTPQRLFVVTQAERVDRGLPALAGMNATLSSDAQTGVDHNADPTYGANPPGVTSWTGWAANWADDYGVLAADYDWMYNDGPGTTNIDCRVAGQSGCWGHRHNILAVFAGAQKTIFGAALAGSDTNTRSLQPMATLVAGVNGSPALTLPPAGS